MNFLKRIRIFWHAFLYGLRSADKTMLTQIDNSNGDGSGVEHKIEAESNVFSDLLKKEETQQVKELRDISYRVYRESEKYKVDTGDMKIIEDENGNKIFVVPDDYKPVVKDTSEIPSEIIDTGENVVLVQGNYAITESLSDALNDLDENAPVRYKLNVEANRFRKFRIEKYAKYLAIKKDNEGNTKMEIYCSIFPREFVVMKGEREKGTIDKSDVFFIQEAGKLVDGSLRYSDIVEFDTIDFVTEKAFNAPALYYYKYAVKEYLSCEKHDNYFVFSFRVIPICDGVDMIAQYRMAEVDAKYAEKAQRTDVLEMNPFTMPGKVLPFTPKQD